MSTKSKTRNENFATIKLLLSRNEERVASVGAGGAQDEARRYIRAALLQASRRPKLRECTPQSFLAAVLVSARLGLIPDSRLAMAHLSAELDERSGDLEALLVPGYQGLVNLLLRTEPVVSVEARVVHQRDAWDVSYGLSPKLEHEPYLDANPGEPLFVYAIARLADGSSKFEILNRQDVEAVATTGADPDSAKHWKSQRDLAEVWKALAIKRLAKTLAKGEELAAAIYLHRGAEACSYSPRILDVAESLGIEVESDELAVDAGPVSAAPKEPVAVPVATLRCCSCGRSVEEVGYLRSQTINPKHWTGCKGCGGVGVKHDLCVTCSDQHATAERNEPNTKRGPESYASRRRRKITSSPTPSPSGNGGAAGAEMVGVTASPSAPAAPPEPRSWLSKALGVEPGSSPLAPDPANNAGDSEPEPSEGVGITNPVSPDVAEKPASYTPEGEVLSRESASEGTAEEGSCRSSRESASSAGDSIVSEALAKLGTCEKPF